ncbi:MAG TPA: YggT family protein [Clostridia bacterium]|nr:YggT family protein [Clostridia bacterium]HPQ47912.1 YggT family protein [Clostridia bacterium]HRX42906.1 YggT family protein [Clostridia bacterium]
MSIWAKVIYYFLEAVSYMLIARILLSWFPQVRGSRFYEILVQLTEPLLIPIRRLLSRTRMASMPFDVSVIIVYLIIMILQMLIVQF